MVRFLAGLLCLVFGANAGIKIGQPAPEISLDQLLPDQPVASATLHALKGKAVVLEFWATWCGPCVMAIPRLNELAVEFKNKPVVFLSITAESRAEIEPFLKKRPIEGWVGLTKDRKVLEDYGVTSLTRTFLIDAEGNLAADLAAYNLTAGMLNDLLARRPVSVPKPVPFSTRIRQLDDSLSPPLFDVMIRPTTAIERGGGVGRGNGELMMKALTPFGMLIQTSAFLPTRITGDAIEDKTRYDLWISLPGASREALQRMALDAICAAFHLNVRKETRDTAVYLLTAPNGRQPGLIEAQPMGFSIFSKQGKGSLKLTGPLLALSHMIENVVGKPVLDQTGIAGSFEIRLTYQDGVPGSLEEAVQSLGLKLEPARRPVEFLAVTTAQNIFAQ
jgi:uncharacterized protein (TIGR03435 family)